MLAVYRRKAPTRRYLAPDEVVVRINGRKCWLWRAVGQDGHGFEEIVQTRRNQGRHAPGDATRSRVCRHRIQILLGRYPPIPRRQSLTRPSPLCSTTMK
ncbi:DDE-type integrase/transposase/recombinase [Mesorhizobium sp. M1227]|uniref:DDE-type integrase/transposase/recombinase n=1 Tax=Mesorhizobium sp. M1227 TaxID=2957071 RepID=UPI00333CD70C